MPTTIPALRGKFGSAEYWLTTMRVGELVRRVTTPKDMPGWEDPSIEDEFQRDINIKRVASHIAPYFAGDDNRFSGSIVLAVINHENLAFESIGELPGGGRVPQVYQSAGRDIGFLTMNGGELFVPLDGQHRVKAFKFAMSGVDDTGKALPKIKSNTALAEDHVAVILIRYKPDEARRIFNKINRYAKPTTKSDNLITDDDDAIAVITRELLSENGVIPSALVRRGSNTLSANAPEFIPLATFYEANLAIVLGLGLKGEGTPHEMTEDQSELAQEDMRRVWELLLERIDLFSKATSDATPKGDETRIQIRAQMLLGKPVGQLALVRGFLEMRVRCAGVSEETLCARLNRIDWSIDADQWKGVLVAPNGRVLSGRTVVNTAADFIAHLGGGSFSEEEKEALLDKIHGPDWKEEGLELPKPVDP